MNSAKQRRYDKAYLRMASTWAKLSHCKRKQVGAIIVKDQMIISDGYNGTPAGFDNCCEDDENNTHWYVLHAEANAILKVAKSTNNAKNSNTKTKSNLNLFRCALHSPCFLSVSFKLFDVRSFIRCACHWCCCVCC